MAYSKQTWVRGEKVASAKLNHMEDGIDAISANGAIDTENIADGAVYTEKLADDAVTYDKLDQNAVDSVNIRNGAVTAAKLGTDVQDILDNKADIDGSYESMTVGNAEQLVSTVGVEDNAPYTFRTTGGSADVGDRMNLKAVVGGTVAWNQIVPSNKKTLSHIPSGENTYDMLMWGIPFIAGHTYYVSAKYTYNGSKTKLRCYCTASGIAYGRPSYDVNANSSVSCAWLFRHSANGNISLGISNIETAEKLTSDDAWSIDNGFVIDLTNMFGSTIADYVYTLESGTAGAGVAWLKKYGFFTKPYYPYKAAALESVKTSAHKTIGFNQFDKSKAVNSERFNTTGTAGVTATYSRSDWIRVVPNTAYYFKDIVGYYDIGGVYWYDADKHFIKGDNINGYSPQSGYFTSPANAYYVGVNFRAVDIDSVCVSLRWDGERDGEYEPYEEHTYALDDVELRGIPKLDASNNLYYDGDRYLPDGTVERRYAEVDLGALTWTAQSLSNNRVAYITNYTYWDDAPWLDRPNFIIPTPALCVAFDHMVAQGASSWGSNVGVFTFSAALLPSQSFAIIKDSGIYADAAAFKAAMNNVKLVYKIATPTTESADPYTELQICDDFGTEEFVDAAFEAGERDVAIPVGNVTFYPQNLRKKIEGLPFDFSTLIVRTEKAFKATKAYAANEFLIINNQLYKVRTSIANGATITVGTNVIATTIGTELTAILNS